MAAVALAIPLAAVQSLDRTAVVAVGDSIWRGTATYDSWRRPLADLVRFHGAYRGSAGNSWANDRHLAVHGRPAASWDATVAWADGTVAADAFAALSPGIRAVVIHLGTNDVIKGVAAAETAAAIRDAVLAALDVVVAAARARWPLAHIFVCQIIPPGAAFPTRATATATLNIGIGAHGWPPGVSVIDCHTGFSTTWLVDAAHPGDTGDAWLAATIRPHLRSRMVRAA